jgi:asparaginyl-tRNA synthetase
MLNQVYIRDVSAHVGREISIRGWLYNKTHKGRLWFLLVRDGTGVIQSVLFKGNVAPEVFEAAEALTQESSLRITGTVRRDQRAPGGYELDATAMEVVQIAQSYPITPKEHGTSFLMDHRHLWLRSSRQHAILRIRHQLIKAARDFFDGRGFVLVDTPILTGAVGESASSLFTLPYYDLGEAHLAQTGQLYLEAACQALGKVYNFGPTFRAEKSKTRRHLSEFWMLEAEVAFADSDANMQLQEDLVLAVVEHVLARCESELATLERDTAPLERLAPPFPRIAYDEAVRIAQASGAELQLGEDLGADEETAVSLSFDRPVFVTDYPRAAKAFYMKGHPTDPDRVRCSDLLAPEGYGEIAGGSQREDDLDALVAAISAHGLPVDAYEWYLDLRRFGSVPHAGFGIGLERTLAWIAGIPHVREAIAFPRTLQRLYP